MKHQYGRLMLDLTGTNLSNEDKALIQNKHVGGLIFFSRNFESFDQIKDLVDEIRSIKENIIIAVDQEGGRVQRFKKEFTEIPSMQKISKYAISHNDAYFFKGNWMVDFKRIGCSRH
jgi:beta-N-acetylhexosaminidase